MRFEAVLSGSMLARTRRSEPSAPGSRRLCRALRPAGDLDGVAVERRFLGSLM
jgi:hypothetical protein